MLLFENIIKPQPEDIILDVGGVPETWLSRPQIVKRIDILNLTKIEFDSNKFPDYNINTIVGDGCSLPFDDKSYDIVYSNSVIEHVGDWDRQKAFANEVRRVGKKIWVQTPAYECPFEPHYLGIFIHWFPVNIRRKIVRWFTLRGLIDRPSQEMIDNMIKYTNIINKVEFTTLFYDCEIIMEKLFPNIIKSYIAYKNNY